METTEKKYRGKVIAKSINYKGDLKVYTFEFRTGKVTIETENPLGVMPGDIIQFNCKKIDEKYIASNIKKLSGRVQAKSKFNKSDKRLLSL